MSSHSFAVLAYGDSPYLVECLLALKNQTVPSEIYISTSTPSGYLDEISRRFSIPIIVTEKNRGIAHDWNFALHSAKTKYVTLAHQDDVYSSQYTEQCLKLAGKYHDMLICFTGYSEIVNGTERKNTFLLNAKKLLLW